ncbi:cytochrome P450 6a9-like [Condylostylus longicornis]|uniref:cytochrome P450 6a9-like n=1 Tax=Condylostylus longicornis TaxID=2530218 RepID=UPI00244D9F7E|nr:cytochrome P450 6a9-like [Condylostylus longicornis]
MGISLIISTIVLGLLGFLYYLIKQRYSFWKNNGIPFLEPTIPFGNFKDVNRTVIFHEWMQKIYNDFKGEILVGIFVLFRPGLIILDLDLIKNILIKDFNQFTDRGLFSNEKDDPLSAHLFSLDGQKWKSLRNKLSPTFTSGKMKFMFPTVFEIGKKLEETLSELIIKENHIEIKDLLARFTTDVIGNCAFGIECNSLKDPNAEFRVMGRRLVSKTRHGPLITFFKASFPDFAKKLGFKEFEDVIINFFLKVVKETVEYREKNNIERNDFLNLLIKIKNSPNENELHGITIEEIAAQVFLFFLAGFETSSSTLGFLLYEIAQNHEIQNKMRSEINEVLKDFNGDFTYEAMTKLNYMDQVISETLRKYPPVVNLLRKCISDYKVEGTNYVIPNGTVLIIPVYPIQHDPEIYPNPEKFNPDNYNQEAINSRHSSTFLAFGDGPRNCLGLRFGKMQTKVGLVTLLSKFKFSVCDATPIPLKFNMKSMLLNSEGGIPLKIEKL